MLSKSADPLNKRREFTPRGEINAHERRRAYHSLLESFHFESLQEPCSKICMDAEMLRKSERLFRPIIEQIRPRHPKPVQTVQ